jgi:carboxypeptidase Taq
VEADELSYTLQIALRFELELALPEQQMPVEELPQQWNRLFGYFISYALGHLISAQLSEAMEAELGGEGRVA